MIIDINYGRRENDITLKIGRITNFAMKYRMLVAQRAPHKRPTRTNILVDAKYENSCLRLNVNLNAMKISVGFSWSEQNCEMRMQNTMIKNKRQQINEESVPYQMSNMRVFAQRSP